MRGDYWLPNQEALITDFEYECLKLTLDRGYNVIFDSTNLNPKTIKKIEKIVSKYPNHEIEYKFIDTPLDVCIERDSKRECPVGKMVIMNFYNRYIKNDK